MDEKSPIERQSLIQNVFSFTAVLIVSIVAIGALAVIMAQSQDRLAKDNSVHLARSVLDEIERQLARQLVDYSYWDVAVDKLVTELDPEWADNNVGIYAYDSLGMASSFVLDANDQTVYAMIDGERREDNALTRFAGGIDKLLDRARAAPPTAEPVPASGFLTVNGAVHFAAASRLTTYVQEGGSEQAIGTESVLMFTKALDADMIAEIGKNYLLVDLRLAPPAGAMLPAELALTAPDGTKLANLTWRPETPAQETLTWIMPLIGLLLVVFVVVALVFYRNTKKVTYALIRYVAEIRAAETALRKSERRNREFAANAAHELRTPLAYFHSHLDNQPDSPAIRELLKEVDLMSRLVEQLLALTRADSITVGPEDKADLHAVCVDVAAYLAPIAIKENRLVEVVGADGPVHVRGNAEALEMALRNLVENAIKYSDDGTTVTIDVSDDGTVRVLDIGPGIPASVGDSVFDRFARFDNRASGFGLGLPIVRRVAESHGGSVEVGNNPMGGAEFVIRVPIAA